MALTEGTGFLLIDHVAYVGCQGTGKSCLALTKDILLMVPVETQVVINRKLRTTKWSIGGVSPSEAIRNESLKVSADLDSFSVFLRSVPEIVEPSILHDLTIIQRLNVRTGIFSRGIYVSDEERGPGWRGYSLKKRESILVREFYTGHPAAVF